MPNLKFESIKLDIIVELPKTQPKFNIIMVVMDRLIKIVYFIRRVTTITALEVVQLFMREIFRYHGIPREIISDKDSKFISEFWTTIFKLCETKILS